MIYFSNYLYGYDIIRIVWDRKGGLKRVGIVGVFIFYRYLYFLVVFIWLSVKYFIYNKENFI